MGYHYVPQKYLEGFACATHPCALWQFDKQSRCFSREPLPIKRIAQAREYYDSETESRLNTLVECPGNRVLEKLRSGDHKLKPEERVQLSIYIATMLKRVPNHRAKGYKIAPGTLAQVAAELREQIQAHADAGNIPQVLADRRLAEAREAETNIAARMPATVEQHILSPWPSKQMIALVLGMHWRFVQTDITQRVVTSDNPAFYFECFGLGTEHAELTFPICSNLVLFGKWTPIRDSKHVIRKTKFVKEANRRAVIGASRFVYTGHKADWITELAGKDVSALSRIMW